MEVVGIIRDMENVWKINNWGLEKTGGGLENFQKVRDIMFLTK